MEQLDKLITLWINSLHCEATDYLWIFLSDKTVWYPFYVVVAFFIFYRLGWKRGLIAFFSIVLTIVACDQTCNLFKEGVARLRPCCDAWMLENGLHALEGVATWSGPFGFFSAHAANALGFAVSSSRCFKWDKSRSYKVYSTAVTIWACFVALSRVFAGRHFLGDVIVGAIVGVLLGLLLSGTGNIIRKKCIANS